ncbi:MAG TPA: dephospho-CoA kinase, partial [Candidatus Omnitrophota bacterium]|nr:dephospho-CoA kinase [Candidatus Omnitrophota bacterium]
MKKVKVIGITGIFASGKSTVSDMLEAKGAVKIDADRIGHSLLEKNAGVKNELVAVFGAGILSNGKIDRKKL